jgi:HD-GYP domain-containing protein (c-di-GMP phosphodiesterase class II)
MNDQARTNAELIEELSVLKKRIQELEQSGPERERVEEEQRKSLEQLRRAVETIIQVLVMAVEVKDPYTAGHQRRVTKLARRIAMEMGLPPEKIECLRLVGVIHDIGKITLPTEVLSKPTNMSALEISLISEHVRLGYDILKNVESSWPMAEIVYQHHERMDGSGYPRNLKGEEILIEARILAVADVVEAMASNRPYRPAVGLDAALDEIEKNRGVFYDAAVADACLTLFREKGFQF